MNKGDGCNDWKYRQTDTKAHKKIALNAIANVYNKLTLIEQILNEDIELNKLKDKI